MNDTNRQLLNDYNRISNWRGAFDLVMHWGLIILMFWLVYWSQNILVGLFAIVVIAGLQNALASLGHETFHYKVFTSRRANSLVGAFFYSYPLGLPHETYRKRHLDHHRRVGDPSDPDWGNYQGDQFASASAVYRFYLGRLLGAYLVKNVLTTLSGKKPPVLETGSAEDSGSDMIYMALTQVVLFGLVSVFFAWWMYFILWLLPLVTVTSFLVGFRAYLEHNDPDGNSVVEDRLFDYRPGPVEHFLVSPCHFHLHAIHHAFPAVPHYRLDTMKAELAERDIDYPCQDRGSYVSTFFEKVGRLP